MKKTIACLAVIVPTANLFAQIDAGLFRFPDVSQTQIVFTYANDLWLIPKEGGTAIKLSSPAGCGKLSEIFSRWKKHRLQREL
jgi:tricorn protease